MDPAGSMLEVNQTLREPFSEFTLHEVEGWGGKPGIAPGARHVLVEPRLRPDVAHRLSDEWPALDRDRARDPAAVLAQP